MQILKSNIDVSNRILDPKLPINPQLVVVKSTQSSNLAKVIYANSITLTPGTISIDLDQSDIQKHKSGLEDAIKRFAGVHGVGLASFKEKDVVRHSLVKRLLKRYRESFNVMDDVSAEKTISMWIREEGWDVDWDGIPDGSLDNDYQYKIKK